MLYLSMENIEKKDNLEKDSSPEKIGEKRKELLELEKEGIYVFHGSAELLDFLEPQLAHNDNELIGEREKDKTKFVYASPYADVAIFRALTKNYSSRFGVEEGRFNFSISKKCFEDLKKEKGYVYVLSKKMFNFYNQMEHVSQKKLKPIQVVEVSFKELPENIDLELEDGS